MRCVSCAADVPPQWVAALEANICPGCGGQIMSDESKDLMAELQGAIAKMPNDPKGLAGWILSNYRIKKIGSAEPTEYFHRKGGGPGDDGQIKIADSGIDKFMSRTGMSGTINNTMQSVNKHKIQNSKYQELANSINNIDVEDDQEEEEPDKEDLEYVKELNRQGINPFSNGLMSNKSVVTPQNIKEMLLEDNARSNVGQNNDLYNFSKEENDVVSSGEKGREAVLKSRVKRIAAQEGLSNGVGGFRR